MSYIETGGKYPALHELLTGRIGIGYVVDFRFRYLGNP